MHQSKKGNPWFFGMKAHIGVDADSGLLHTARSTAGNVNDVIEANDLPHGHDSDVFADAGYQGAAKWSDARAGVRWRIAMRPGQRRALDKNNEIDQIEKFKASVRAEVEHPFKVIKRQFGHVKVRYWGLREITAQHVTLFAPSNLWTVRGKLLDAQT